MAQEEEGRSGDLKMHINGKAMDEDDLIPDMETIFKNLHEASFFVSQISQMPTTESNLTQRQNTYAQSTHLMVCSRCADYVRD